MVKRTQHAKLTTWSQTGDLWSHQVERIPSNIVHPKMDPLSPAKLELVEALVGLGGSDVESQSSRDGLMFSAHSGPFTLSSKVKSTVYNDPSEMDEAEESLLALADLSQSPITPAESASQIGSHDYLSGQADRADAARILYYMKSSLNA